MLVKLNSTNSYFLPKWTIILIVIVSVAISIYFKWMYSEIPVNFMSGDAEDYYSTLVSIFIKHNISNQTGTADYLLRTSTGTVNVHPIGVSVLLFPFFLVAYLFASIFGFAIDGYSLPFQISVSVAGLFYCILGLVFLVKLLRLNSLSDKIISIVLLIIYFGTNLMHYALSEAGMSHVYSFSLISIFLFHSANFIQHQRNFSLIISFLMLAIIFLVRPNNILILFSVFIWFKNFKHCKEFFKNIFRIKSFYFSLLLFTIIIFFQNILWFIQSEKFFQNTYQGNGFYWNNPQFLKMLFG